MRLSGVFVLFSLLLTTALRSQTNWQDRTPEPAWNQSAAAVAFADSMTIVIAMQNGDILRSVDKGTTWAANSIHTNSSNRLTALSFADSRNGIAVGLNSLAVRTTDGGANWQRHWIAAGNVVSMYAVAALSPGCNVCAGDTGAILRTENGGGTWTRVPAPTRQRLLCLAFPDSVVGYCAGAGGVILKTTDAGLHWTALNSNTTRDLTGIHFLDRLHGYAVADWVVMKTVDGGDTWTPEFGQGQAVRFLDAHTGFTAMGSALYRTTNAAKSWARVSTEATTFVSSAVTITSIAFATPTFGIAVGTQELMLITRDGGETWFLRGGIADSGRAICMQFPAPDRGYFGSYNGDVWRSDDSGASWHHLITPTTTEIDAISFHSRDSGRALTVDGFLATTTNGGVSWGKARLPIATSFRTLGLAFRDKDNGFVVGSEGLILRTRNGGTSWTQQWSGTNATLRCIAWTDTACAVAAGDAGVVVRSTDGGDRWLPVTTPVPRAINALQFTDASTGTASGYQGLCMRSTDAGATWKAIGLPGGTGRYSSLATAFADARWGILGGNNTRTMLETTASPLNWKEVKIGPQYDIYWAAMRSVCFPDALHGIFGMDDTRIFRGSRTRAAAPLLSVSSDSIGMGRAVRGTTLRRRLWIANIGGSATIAPALAFIGPDAPEFSIAGAAPVALPADGSRHAVDILWQAGSTGTKQAVLRLTANDAVPAVTDIAISAEVVKPMWTVDVGSLQFDNTPLLQSAERALVLTSLSDVALPAPALLIEGTDQSQFSIVSASPPWVEPGMTTTITVRHTPTHVGRTAMTWLRFPADASVMPFETIALQGTSIVRTFSTDKGSVDFGTMIAGEYSISSLRIINTSPIPLHVFEQTISGPDSALFRIIEAAAGTLDSGQSSRILIGCSTSSLLPPPPPLVPDVSGDNSVRMRNRSALRASLNVRMDDSGSGRHAWQLRGQMLDHGIQVTPETLIFDSTATGASTTLALTFSNSMVWTAALDAAIIEGNEAVDFAVAVPDPRSIDGNRSATLDVTFAPKSPGWKQAVLRLRFSDANRYDVLVPLSGPAARLPLEIRPPTLRFDTLHGLETAVSGFSIVNTSSKQQTFGPITWIAGNRYSFTLSTPAKTRLEPGDSTRVTVTCHPSSHGPLSSTFKIPLTTGSRLYASILLLGFNIGFPIAVDHPALPLSVLGAPYPHPARDIVTVPFSLAGADHAVLSVHDALGRRVAVLAEDSFAAGGHTRSFDASQLPAGLYLMVLEAGRGGRHIRRFIIAR